MTGHYPGNWKRWEEKERNKSGGTGSRQDAAAKAAGSDRVNIGLRRLARTALKLFWFFPLKRDQILFQSFEGGSGYNDNPRYISDALLASGCGCHIVWAFADPASRELPAGIEKIRYGSLAWFKALAVSGVIVFNVRPPVYLPKRNGQTVIQTWHGGGAYKRINVYDSSRKVRTDWATSQIADYTDVYLTSSEIFTRYNILEAYPYKNRILQSGMPRNDLFFDPVKVSEARHKVKEIYGLEDKIALYAPTFRSTKIGSESRLPYGSVLWALEKKLGGPVSLLSRSHHHDSGRYASDARVTDVTDYPDMQELLCAADVLITDYSSSIWDYALLGRPCLLYVPDLKDYDRERGFFTPPEEWPGVLCPDEAALLDAIEGLDPEDSRLRAGAYLKASGSYESGTACREVLKIIDEAMGIGK